MKKTKIKVASILVILILVAGSYLLLTNFTQNRAEEAVKPVQHELVKLGAQKLCENGNSGRGPDNQAPWSQTFYDLPQGKDQAVSTVYKIANENGYNLTHASATNKGFLDAVSDNFIDKWYFSTNKNTPYSDMQQGPVKLAFAVDGPGSTYECGSKKLEQGHSVVGIDVRLTDYK
jgi:hypothetical protein